MAINLDKPNRWKSDIIQSVDMYNKWFMEFAPVAFRTTRIQTTADVETALNLTANLTNIKPAILRGHPEILPTLRMSTCRDRLGMGAPHRRPLIIWNLMHA